MSVRKDVYLLQFALKNHNKMNVLVEDVVG